MPLSQDQEEREHGLRIDHMSVNIEQMRLDMAERQKAAEERAAERQKAAEERAAERQKELTWETRKFVVSAIVAAAAALGAGVGLGNLIWARRPPVAPQPIVIQLQTLPPMAAPPPPAPARPVAPPGAPGR